MQTINVDWQNLKSFVDARFLSIQYLDINNCYYLSAFDGPFALQCTLNKDGSPQQLDFETNYKANGNASFSDVDGTPMQRVKASKKGWTYAAIPVEVKTSRLQTNNLSAIDDLFCKDSTQSDISGVSVKIYKADGTEITTPGIANANCLLATKTVVDFELLYDYEIIGGVLRTENTISTDVRLWIIGAPDVPAQSGGSKEMCSGLNLKFLAPGNEFKVDGRVTKLMRYNATYHTGKLRLIFTYPAGTYESLSCTFEIYRA